MTLTKAERDALPDTAFAIAATRELPLVDERHIRMAWGTIDQARGLDAVQRAEGRRHILAKAEKLGIDTTGWLNRQAAMSSISAMSVVMPHLPDHPNRMPFSGIMTRIDEPSDSPPGGANSRRVIITKAVAEAALPTLLGMAVDFTPDLDGHDSKAKIGIITDATIEGNAIHIAGYLFANDFPSECARIRKEKNQLGFSYECLAAISDRAADPWVPSFVIFTGAAVLKKHLAAYTTTSLAAQAEGPQMTPEQMAAIQDGNTKLAASMNAGFLMLAEALKPKQEDPAVIAARAAKEDADKRELAAKAERDADRKQISDLAASVASLTTVVTDLKASAFKTAEGPTRKTMSAEVQGLLAKAGITDEQVGKLTVPQADAMLKAAGITGPAAMAAKIQLNASGVLAK